MCNECSLGFPIKVLERDIELAPGDIIRLGRFEGQQWQLEFGWYSYCGNPEVFGLYLKSLESDKVRPLQQRDLADIRLVTHGGNSACCN